MRILGIDTSAMDTNMVVADGGRVIGRASRVPEKTHSRELLKSLDKILYQLPDGPESIDIVAVACGPGSFTGLRIGMGTALGLSDAWGKPAMGIGTLDAMAEVSPLWDGGYICPILNARRGEVYAALFTVEEGALRKVSDDLAVSPSALAGMIDRPVMFVGDGFEPYSKEFREKISHRIEAVPSTERTAAEGVAIVALREADDGRIGANPPAPRYIRRPQAEINWEKLHA